MGTNHYSLSSSIKQKKGAHFSFLMRQLPVIGNPQKIQIQLN